MNNFTELNNISIIRTRAHRYQDQLVRLWHECLPGTPEERFDWLASGNPAGPAEWFLALDDEDILVAASSVMPKEFFYNGRKIRGGVVGDIMVAANFRGKGIARKIQKLILNSLPELGMEFLYVVPNNNSNHLLLQAGERKKICLKNYLIPVDVGYYINSIGYNFLMPLLGRFLEYFLDRTFSVTADDHYSVCVQENFDEEINVLWQSVKDVPGLLVGSKSATYLNWKYFARQDEHYQILKYRRPSGRLVGYCIFTIADAKIHIYELITLKREYYVHLLSALRSWAKSEQYIGIYFYTLKNNPVLAKLRTRGLFRIGGDIHLLCIGAIFENYSRWLFFPGDRNI